VYFIAYSLFLLKMKLSVTGSKSETPSQKVRCRVSDKFRIRFNILEIFIRPVLRWFWSLILCDGPLGTCGPGTKHQMGSRENMHLHIYPIFMPRVARLLAVISALTLSLTGLSQTHQTGLLKSCSSAKIMSLSPAACLPHIEMSPFLCRHFLKLFCFCL